MAKKKTEGSDASRDDLLDTIVASLKKDGVDAYFLAREETPLHLMDFISTGASLLDLAIANRANSGIPIGRISEIAGLEGTGKSLICAHMIANVQKRGGIAILFDTESATSLEFFKAVGVDLDRLVLAHENRIETIFDKIKEIIASIRQKEENQKEVLIIVDSIAAATCIKDLESDGEQKGYGTEKSKFLSRILPTITSLISKQKIALVFTNQLRQKLNAVAFGDQYQTTGGKAAPYYFSVRVRLAKVQTLKNKDKQEVGVTVEAKVVKNRLGPPGKKAQFDIYYDRGIDDTASWIKFLTDNEIVSGASGNWRYESDAGEDFKFTTATWPDFKSRNSKIADEIYNKVAEMLVSKYQSKGVSTVDGTAVTESSSDGANANAEIEE